MRSKPPTGAMLPILVADDEPAIRRLHVRALERAGFATLEATDGGTALARIQENDVGLVLLDLHMPGMSGVEVIERIRADARTRTLPVILVTGSGDVEARIRGLEAGANDYVVKTTPLAELVARVRSQVRSRVAWGDVLATRIERRARLVASLVTIHGGASPEETAAEIVEVLAAQPGISHVTLLHLDPTGELLPLAGWKASKGSWVGGMMIARQAREYLLARAASGPWIEETPDDRLPALALGTLSPGEVGAMAFFPLGSAQEPLGLLGLGTSPGATPFGGTGDLLAATIDFGGVVGALLGSALADRGEETRQRRRLSRILTTGSFHPVFQPWVDLADGHLVGFEALTRFSDGTRPDVRFAEAERHGLGRAFEEATLTAALRAAQALPDGFLSLNVHPSLLLETHWLLGLLAARDHRRVVIELTEHTQVEDYARLRRAIGVLGDGFDVAIDDAGAGFASLRHILELRPHFVKLDMALVRGIEADPVRQALVAGLVYFALHTASMLIAEGVETEAEAETLRRLAVPLAQGYLFGKPEPAAHWVG